MPKLMDFNTLNFTTLVSRFEKNTLPTLLATKKIETKEQLDEPRRSQVKFISYVIEIVTKQLNNLELRARRKYLFQSTETLFGTMLLIRNHINATLRTGQGSVLRDSLNHIMEIENPLEPISPSQCFTCYKALTHLLKMVYIESNSRKGINPQNPLCQFIPIDILVTFMKEAWALEAQSAKEMLATVPVSDKTSFVSPENYKLKKPTPQDVSSSFVDQIESELEALIIIEKGDKKVASVASLPPNRAKQLGFLEKLIEATKILSSTISQKERQVILVGAMHLVREQINLEYKYSILHKDEIAATLVHKKLTELLKVKHADPEHIETLVSAALRFIRYLTIEQKDDSKSMRSEHIFSNLKDFDIRVFLNLGEDVLQTCRTQALNTAVKTPGPAEEQKVSARWGLPSVASFLSRSILGGAAATKPISSQQEEPAATSSASFS